MLVVFLEGCSRKKIRFLRCVSGEIRIAGKVCLSLNDSEIKAMLPVVDQMNHCAE